MCKVSIILPTYNSVQYLENAIYSIFYQTFTNFEIIIVDDGSIDRTQDLVDYYINKFPGKFRYFYQDNRGPASARNRGIREARCEYIAFLDADDMWESQMLEKSLNFIETNNYDWIMCDNYRLEVDINGNKTKKEVQQRSTISHNAGENFVLLLKHDFIGGPSKVLAKRKCFDVAGYFDEKLIIREDWELWLRFTKAGLKLGYLNEPLYNYQIRNNSLTRKKHYQGLLCTMKILNTYCSEAKKNGPEVISIFADQYWNLARKLIRNYGDLFNGTAAIMKSQALRPAISRFRSAFQTQINNVIKLKNNIQ